MWYTFLHKIDVKEKAKTEIKVCQNCDTQKLWYTEYVKSTFYVWSVHKIAICKQGENQIFCFSSAWVSVNEWDSERANQI